MPRSWTEFRSMTRTERDGLQDTWISEIQARRSELSGFYTRTLDRLRNKVRDAQPITDREMWVIELTREQLA